jgi:hypothetical protein
LAWEAVQLRKNVGICIDKSEAKIVSLEAGKEQLDTVVSGMAQLRLA